MLSLFRSVVAVPVVLLNISVVLEGSLLQASVSPPLLRPQLAFSCGSFESPNTGRIQLGHDPSCHGPHLGNGEPKA